MIRPAILSDIEQLISLFDAYRVYYGKNSDKQSARNFLGQRIRNGDSVIYISDVGGKIAGFVQLYPLFSSVRMKKLWLLNDLFVDPAFRGKGISIALIEESKNLCRATGACGMYLETQKDNHIGNRLYPKMGFVLNEAHNFYDWSVE